MMLTIPARPRYAPWPVPRIVILVIILTFVAGMAVLGWTPAVALGVAAAAVAVADDPRTVRAALRA
jgi:hypothetical protein